MIRCVLLAVFITSVLSNMTIRAPDDVVSGRPFTLECEITRPTSDTSYLTWYRDVDQTTLRIYASSVCTSSIQVSPSSPAGLSGGCQHVKGEEIYTVTIVNVTEDTGRGRWTCQYGGRSDNVTLDVQVMVTQVTLMNPPDSVLAGDPSKFACVASASKPHACIRGYIRRSGNVREIDPPTDCNQDGSSVQTTTRTLTFTASAEENGAELYCYASNIVTDPPVRSQLHSLNVHFGPDSVQLWAESGQSVNKVTVTENSTVTFTCTSGGSNPAAVLSWYNNNSPVGAAELSEVSSQRGPNRGYLTTQRYTVRVDRYQDGDVIRCEAQRPDNGKSKLASPNITLDVRCVENGEVYMKKSHVYNHQVQGQLRREVMV